MPFKNTKQKKRYNTRYHRKKLGNRGSYNTSANITYPSTLDITEPFKTKNSFEIGRRRLREFKDLLPNEYHEVEGHKIWMNRVEGRGIDVKIRKNGNMHTVMELTNYSRSSFFSKKTANRYLKLLKRYSDVNRILVVSFDENITNWRRKFEEIGVKIRVMHYQT